MNPTSQLKSLPISDVGLGLYTDVNPLQIPLGGCESCSNMVWVNGYLRARPGVATAFTPAPNANSVTHLNFYSDLSGNVQLMRLSLSGTTLSLYRHNGSWNLVSGAISGGSSAIQPTSCNFKGSFWFTTGDGELMHYDGTTLSSVDSLQSDAILKVFDKPRIVVAGDSRLFIADCHDASDGTGTRVPYRIAWSDFLDGTVWKGGVGAGSSGFVDLPKNNEPITGLYYSNSGILVFKPNRIYLGYAAGPPKNYDFREVVSGIGCVSHATIKQYREGIILWLGDDNIYAGGINRQPQAIGDRIRPRLREALLLSSIDKARAVIDRQNHLYHLFLPDGSADHSGENLRIFTVNLKNGSWWEGSFSAEGLNITDGLEYRDAPWSNRLLLATIDGRILEYSFSNTSDVGVPFSASWVSGTMSVKSFVNSIDQASLQMLRIVSPNEAASKAMTLQAFIGQGLDRFVSSTFGVQTIDGASNIYTSARPKAGETMKISLATADSSSMPKIASMSLGVIPVTLNVKR